MPTGNPELLACRAGCQGAGFERAADERPICSACGADMVLTSAGLIGLLDDPKVAAAVNVDGAYGKAPSPPDIRPTPALPEEREKMVETQETKHPSDCDCDWCWFDPTPEERAEALSAPSAPVPDEEAVERAANIRNAAITLAAEWDRAKLVHGRYANRVLVEAGCYLSEAVTALASIPSPDGLREALVETDVLLVELIAKPSSRTFYGIGGVLFGKLKSIHLGVKSALRASPNGMTEGPYVLHVSDAGPIYVHERHPLGDVICRIENGQTASMMERGQRIVTALNATIPGYVAVPIEPTAAMLRAANHIDPPSVSAIYRAMLAASHYPPEGASTDG
jgi:hypothetical protein